jgi:hypothetical protein
MQAEEAVMDLPGVKEGLTLLQELRDPSILTDVGIEGLEHIVDHPVHGLAALSLAEVIALRCMVHISDCEFTGSNERLEVVEVVGTTGGDHLHSGYHEVFGVARVVRVKWCKHQMTFDHLNVKADFTAKSFQGCSR